MYVNLAISLTGDLGLDAELPNPNNFKNISTLGLTDGGTFTDAAKRAYLGCYYLSSASVFLSPSCHLLEISPKCLGLN